MLVTLLVSQVTKHSATTVNYTGKGFGGEREIRTLDTLAGILVFETSAFNHSATSPTGCLYLFFGQMELVFHRPYEVVFRLPVKSAIAKEMGIGRASVYRALGS